jgi:hypothetical protein
MTKEIAMSLLQVTHSVPGVFLAGKGWPARAADNLTTIREQIV